MAAFAGDLAQAGSGTRLAKQTVGRIDDAPGSPGKNGPP